MNKYLIRQLAARSSEVTSFLGSSVVCNIDNLEVAKFLRLRTKCPEEWERAFSQYNLNITITNNSVHLMNSECGYTSPLCIDLVLRRLPENARKQWQNLGASIMQENETQYES